MKDKCVVFSLYGVHFRSRAVTEETAEEMCRQLRDRDIKMIGIADAIPQEMYMIMKADRGEGFHHVDTSGLQVYANPDVAREDLNRFLFKTGYVVAPLAVLQEPHLLGTSEQRAAWESKKEKK